MSEMKLPRFTPVQAAGLTLMVGAVIGAGAIFTLGGQNRTEATVKVDVSKFPHLGQGGQVVALFEDANCLHCREFEQDHLPRLMAAAKRNLITLVAVQAPFLKPSSEVAARMLRCTWKLQPPLYFRLSHQLYSARGPQEPQTGDYQFVLGKAFGRVSACASSAKGEALLEADRQLVKQMFNIENNSRSKVRPLLCVSYGLLV